MSDLNITIRYRDTGGICRFIFYKEKRTFSAVDCIGYIPLVPAICSEVFYADIANQENPTFGSVNISDSIIDWQIVDEFSSPVGSYHWVVPTRKDLQNWPEVQVLIEDDCHWDDEYILAAIDDELGFGVFKKTSLNKSLDWYKHCRMLACS
jgi:hypothetical protein